jgi:hypothetical protein
MSVDYKYKPEKHKFWKSQKTIDELHKEHLEDFRKQHESIPLKKTKMMQLKRELNALERENNDSKPINLNMEYIKKRNSIRRSIAILENDINKTLNYKGEVEYFSISGDVIYDYYDITNGTLYGKNYEDANSKNDKNNENMCDNNKNKSRTDTPNSGSNANSNLNSNSNSNSNSTNGKNNKNNKTNKNNTNNTNSANANSIANNNRSEVTFAGQANDKMGNAIDQKSNDKNNSGNCSQRIFVQSSRIEISDELIAITNSNKKLKLKRPVRKRNKKIDSEPQQSILSLLGVDDENDEENSEVNAKCKASLQNEYLIMMDKEYACSKSKQILAKKCSECARDKVIIYSESMLSCPKCGSCDYIFIESDVPSQREAFTEKPKYPYKKLGHCIEKLNQFLCKGTVNVPSDVMITMEEEIKKHGMAKKNVTVRFLEKMLKKHRLSDQYENIMYIYTKLSGKPAPTISRDEYNRVLKMFSEAEDVYDRLFKPDNRTNFLKYTFVLNKIFLTIGRKDIAEHFKLLKSPTKMKEQENIWRKICKELEWKYHSS